jgi:hypothetical protein
MTVVLAKSIGSGSTFVHEAPNDSSAGDGTTSHLIDRHNHDSQQQQSKTATVGNGTDVHATGSKHTTEAPMRPTLVAQGVPYATNNFSLRDNVAIENLSSSMHADPQHQGAATAWTHSKQQEEAYNHHSHEHHAGTAAANGGHGHDHDQGPEDLPFYSPPRQRQRWGDTQIAPHTNWGDIFFDLFYVAAAYNLGTVLSTDPTATGLMYTVALFFPILSLWLFKTYYDARFYYHDDVFHRGYEIALLMGLATAVLHIKPVKFLSQPTVYQDIYMYGVGLSVASLLAVGKLVEIMACQRYMKSQTGLHPEAFTAVIFDFWSYLTTGLVYAAATGYAGWRFHRTSIQDDNDRQLLRSLDAASAEEAPHSLRETDHVTVWILLAGLVKTVAMYLIRLANKMNSKHDHKA